ncbi:MAG TPA: GerMN domain-containing protein [Streptosporangiaceae bacterium]|jgi:hypothetical protein
MYRLRFAALALALAGLGGLAVPAATVSAATAVPTLTQIRASHHSGYDRLVFQFRGPLPALRIARYVSQVTAEGSGLPVRVAGSARLQVHFVQATGHNAQGGITYGPARRTFALPNLIQVASAGEDEHHLRFGVGLARQEPFHMSTLTQPSRVVIDVRTPYRTVSVRDYFLNSHRFATGQSPYTQPVYRPVIPPATAFGALQRLFAGPTQAERAAGLRFVASQATGFKNLTINDGVARVQLTGGCSSGGSTFTVANEIRPTLKQFPSVHWVKIYDPSGHTERPYGHTDSIPQSLEP